MERDELRERIARALKFTTVHAPACPWGDNYWNRVLDANSRYKVADAVLAVLSGEPAPTEPRRKFTDHGAFDPWHEED